MKNKITWILSIFLLCGALAPVEAKLKKCKEVKEKRSKNHSPGCNCGGKPPNPPKFWFWFNSK
tara:strand:+ start:1114 stop:1302 length:189 start_codon:yes stop_codon:yes gene_type:complete